MKDKTGIILVIFLFLSGCGATKYQKLTMWDGLGYEDEKISEGTYRIKYLSNAHTTLEQIIKFWHMRASELCGEKGYTSDTREDYKHNEDLAFNTHKFPRVVGVATCK